MDDTREPPSLHVMRVGTHDPRPPADPAEGCDETGRRRVWGAADLRIEASYDRDLARIWTYGPDGWTLHLNPLEIDQLIQKLTSLRNSLLQPG
jgi:hypothetical protein